MWKDSFTNATFYLSRIKKEIVIGSRFHIVIYLEEED